MGTCRTRCRTAVLALALLSCSGFLPAHAQPKPGGAAPKKDVVAVLDLEIVNGTKAEASAVSDRLREEILKAGQVTLVDRGQLDAVLNEQAFQQTGCTNQECAVQVGKVLGVRRMITGKVTRLTDTLWQLSVTMTDVETAETLRAETVTHQGSFIDLLLNGVGQLADKLTGAAPAIARPGGFGRAVVTSQPTGAEIVLDGRPVPQKTDSLLDQLAAGQHTVTANLNDLTATQTFTITPGGLSRVELRLVQKPSTVQVNSTPLNANVRLDGQPAGKTPVQLTTPPGRHRLELTLDGYHPVQSEVTVTRGQTAVVTVDLLIPHNISRQIMRRIVSPSRENTPAPLRAFFGRAACSSRH